MKISASSSSSSSMMKIYSRTRTRRITITNWLAAVVLFFAGGAVAETTNVLSDAEIQGRQLAQQLCEARPVASFTNTGVLQIRDSNGNRTNYSMTCEILLTPSLRLTKSGTDWGIVYTSSALKPWDEHLAIGHVYRSPNYYEHYASSVISARTLPTSEFSPFANSDFWLCDLGLEFFHWPGQKVLPHTTTLKRGREYTLLESTNPNPTTNGYSRVVSWIDKETGGILEAEAYDATGKLLKDFAPKSFKKVNGQWELQEMEIRNVQTGSRTRLEFDLPK